MNLDQLASVAQAMVADNKGLLAADESTGTITKRFDTINVESTEDNRRDYRELLFRAEGIGKFISGAILYDETIRQSAADGSNSITGGAARQMDRVSLTLWKAKALFLALK